MTVNYITLGFIGGNFAEYVKNNGISQLKKEFQGAKYSTVKKGSNLDAIVQTPGLGEFEIKIIKDNVGKSDLGEINYTPNSAFWPKMDLYKKSSAIIPAASTSPFSYKITTKNKNTSARFSFKYGIINGSTKLDVGPDKDGLYQVKRVTFYDNSGKRIYSFVPPTRKPKPATSSSSSPIAGTSAEKPSP
jgi:hypothetical protein